LTTNDAALLTIMRDLVDDLLTYAHRLPADVARQLPIVAGDIERRLSPQPLAYLPLPDDQFALADGRRLTVVDHLDLSSVAGRALHLFCWAGPKDLVVQASSDLTPHGRLLHVSLSFPDRNPSWRDIRQVRDACYPADVDVMLVLPRSGDYVNVHQHCFHLWQMPVEWALR
jgi:hypothetical protein